MKKRQRGRLAFILVCEVMDSLGCFRGTIEKLILTSDRTKARDIVRDDLLDLRAQGGDYSDLHLWPVRFFGYRFRWRPNGRRVLQWNVELLPTMTYGLLSEEREEADWARRI